MTTADVATLGAGLVGALIGGGMTMWAARWTFRRTLSELEKTETRRLKLDCVTNLTGLRFVASTGIPPPDEFKARLAFELNRIPALWADDAAVLKDMRDFYADRSNERLVKLIRSVGNTAKFQFENLSDADLRNIFSMTFRGP